MIINKIKKIVAGAVTLATIMAVNPGIVAHAEWKDSSGGWWYSQGSSYATGWSKVDGQWYYFDASGYMKTGWIIDGGSWYYLKSDGSMAHDCYIGNYYLGSNGAETKAQTQAQTQTQTGTTIKMESQAISVVCPSTWVKTPSTSGAEGYYIDSNGDNINLVSENMQGYSNEDYDKATDASIKKTFGIDNSNAVEKVYNNNKARVSSYSLTYGGKSMSVCQAIFHHNNVAYIFTLTSSETISDANIQTFENLLNTVQFSY